MGLHEWRATECREPPAATENTACGSRQGCSGVKQAQKRASDTAVERTRRFLTGRYGMREIGGTRRLRPSVAADKAATGEPRSKMAKAAAAEIMDRIQIFEALSGSSVVTRICLSSLKCVAAGPRYWGCFRKIALPAF